MPKMHWRWRNRGRDITALLGFRFGSTLPNDDYGLDAAKLIAQHYMRLHVDAERVTRANLRLWAPRLTEKDLANIIKAAKKVKKPPSAAQLGRDWRVSVDEVAMLSLTTIKPFIIVQKDDASRQARRRRKAGATTKRGRRPMGLSPEQMKARKNTQAAARMKAKRAREREQNQAKNPLRKNSHAPSYIRGMKRDGLSVTLFPTAPDGCQIIQLTGKSTIKAFTRIKIDLKAA